MYGWLRVERTAVRAITRLLRPASLVTQDQTDCGCLHAVCESPRQTSVGTEQTTSASAALPPQPGRISWVAPRGPRTSTCSVSLFSQGTLAWS